MNAYDIARWRAQRLEEAERKNNSGRASKEYRLDRYSLDSQDQKDRAERCLNDRAGQGFDIAHISMTEGDHWAFLTVVYVRERKEGGETE